MEFYFEILQIYSLACSTSNGQVKCDVIVLKNDEVRLFNTTAYRFFSVKMLMFRLKLLFNLYIY